MYIVLYYYVILPPSFVLLWKIEEKNNNNNPVFPDRQLSETDTGEKKNRTREPVKCLRFIHFV